MYLILSKYNVLVGLHYHLLEVGTIAVFHDISNRFGSFKMFLTRSFQLKVKEVKEGKEKPGAANGHQFVPVSPSGAAACVACDKSVSGKELLQCSSKRCSVSAAFFLCLRSAICLRLL